MITLVGVGHVFDIGSQIKQIIACRRPSAVALELDQHRFTALTSRAKGEAKPAGLNFAARFQERIASQFGVQAGDEMLAAAEAAVEIHAKLLLIDMDINRVLYEIRQTLTFEEKVKFFFVLLASPFVRKKTVEKELKKYEEDGEEYLDQIGEDFPTIKRVLVDKRNAHMAKALGEIEDRFGTVLAVIGDGHVPGIERLLAERGPEVIRLAEVRNWKPEPVANGVSFSISYEI